MPRFDSNKWLEELVKFNLEVGGTYHRAIAQGLAIRFDETGYTLADVLAPVWFTEAFLTEERAADLVRHAESDLFLANTEDHTLLEICHTRDDAESVIALLSRCRWLHPMHAVALRKSARMFDDLFYNVVRGKALEEVDRRLLVTKLMWPESYWAYPSWHRCQLDAATTESDLEKADWKYLDSIYRTAG